MVAVRLARHAAAMPARTSRSRVHPPRAPSPPAQVQGLGRRSIEPVRLPDIDPSLLGRLPPRLAAAAREQLVARAVRLDAGRWDPRPGELHGDFRDWLGLLILDGLIVRGVDVDGLRCCELLGPGDVLRPWDDDGSATLATVATWRVLEDAKLALLDQAFARRACRWPSVTAELIRRTMSRSRSLTISLAITQARRADVRVRTLFSHLADRWGRVTPRGVVLTAKLTHSMISQLTGLRRPTVSLTLTELERAGEIVRVSKDTWLINPAAADRRVA
jgi:CRP/FNR family cyclic AMP-dependent transcriptional regulator